MENFGKLCVTALVTTSMLAQSASAFAETPGSVRDLVGARAAGGENALEERGFSLHHASTKDDSKINYWWNPNTKECIKAVVYDGKFESLKKTTNADCGQKSGKNDAGIAIAVGAAALLGIAALSSKSHHREDKYNNQQSTADFERGYRDGLYNQAYHNYGRSDAYSDGYTQGVEQRGHETSYRSNNYNTGGYVANIYVGDLNGQARESATSQLRSRGFAMRDDKRTEDGRYRTFWNGSTKQCLVMVSRNGYVSSLDNVSKSTCRD